MDEDKKKKQSISKQVKRTAGCLGVLLTILAILAGIIGILTVTGYSKRWICSAVLDDSYIWDKINCLTEEDSNDRLDDQASSEEIRQLLESGRVEDRIEAVVQLAQPSVVGIGIKSEGSNTTSIIGTGFVIENGYIVTNYHVVKNTNFTYFVQVKDVSDSLAVQKIYGDEFNDLAVLRVENSEKLKSLPLGDSSELKVGQTVIAIGNPLGELTGTVTQGIISGLHRTVEVGGSFADPGVEKFEDAIQTDAAINSGNSGGLLIDLEGRVIGINFATVGGADNLSFALPINRVKSRISELNKYGEFRMPFLGVEYRNRVTFFENKSLLAAEIITISENSPAQMANLKQGDMIVGYNGKSLEEKSLTEYIQSSNIGDEVTLNIIRDNQRVEIKAKIGTR